MMKMGWYSIGIYGKGYGPVNWNLQITYMVDIAPDIHPGSRVNIIMKILHFLFQIPQPLLQVGM